MLDDEMARQHERGNLGVAEALEQAPDVAVDRLLPDAAAPVEIPADERAVDARVDRRRIEGHQTTFGMAHHANCRRDAVARAEAVHRREHLLDFVPNHVASHVERLPVQPLAPGLLALVQLRIARLDQFAPDHDGNEQFAAAVGEDPGELSFGRQAGCETEDLFGSLTRIGYDDDMRGRLAVRRLHEQPFSGYAVDHGPANLVDTVSTRLCHERRPLVVAETFEAGRQTDIYHADDFAQPVAVVLDRRIPAGGRRTVVLPEAARPCLRVGHLALDEAMRAVHHPGRQVRLGPIERCGLRQRSGRRRDLHGRGVPGGAPSQVQRDRERQPELRVNPNSRCGHKRLPTLHEERYEIGKIQGAKRATGTRSPRTGHLLDGRVGVDLEPAEVGVRRTTLDGGDRRRPVTLVH